MVRLHQSSAIPLPGTVDTESISLDKKTAQGIFILTIPGGPTAKGKLKGAKIKARPEHPLFGTSSRLSIILDEAQEIPANIFDEIPNHISYDLFIGKRKIGMGKEIHFFYYCVEGNKLFPKINNKN